MKTRYNRYFESQNLSVDLFHYTQEKNKDSIFKKGLQLNTSLFGKAVYLQPEGTKMSYENKDLKLQVILKNSTRFYDDFNNNNGYKEFSDFMKKNNLNKNNIASYFIKLGYDGLNLINFKMEPQIVLYNVSKIMRIKIV